MNEKLTWGISEVISYLEEKIISDTATEDELTMYENYKWDGKINRKIYKLLVSQMREEYMGGF